MEISRVGQFFISVQDANRDQGKGVRLITPEAVSGDRCFLDTTK